MLTTDSAKRLIDHARWIDAACCLALVSLSLGLGMYTVSNSGPLWDDGPQYANGGAMIRDWLASGEFLHPYRFAQNNYAQYPFFSVPYHPPGYPGLLGLWFLMVGTSYPAARCFIALCLGGAACSFCGILRRQGATRAVAFAGALLLLTTPEIARWSRCTMSEVPALMFILAGSYCFVRWVDTDRRGWCWAAFLLAEVAFFCRVTTAGVLPAWFAFLLTKRDYRRFLSAHLAIPTLLYMAFNVAWVRYIVTGFAQYELDNPLWQATSRFSWENLSFYPGALPQLSGWLVLIVAGISTSLIARNRTWARFLFFWLSWLLSNWLFHCWLNVHEPRYFTFALPSVCALATGLLLGRSSSRVWTSLTIAVAGLMIVANCTYVVNLPQGVVGMEAVAERLAQLDQPGNVLLACPSDSDLAFRFRGRQCRYRRQMIRADRTLAVRTSDYTGVAPRVLATSASDVLDVIHRGRVRYVLTYSPWSPPVSRRTAEEILVHDTLSGLPEQFTLIDQFSLTRSAGRRGPHCNVHLWQFRGELPPGPSEIPIVIPTASLTLLPE